MENSKQLTYKTTILSVYEIQTVKRIFTFLGLAQLFWPVKENITWIPHIPDKNLICLLFTTTTKLHVMIFHNNIFIDIKLNDPAKVRVPAADIL